MIDRLYYINSKTNKKTLKLLAMATNASSGISLSGVWPSSGGGPSSLSGSTQTPSEPPQRPSGQERTGLLPRQGHIGGAVGHTNIRAVSYTHLTLPTKRIV